MHGKAILVDGRDLLVTSANMTFHGMRHNIELGIRVRGRHVELALDFFNALLRSDLLEPI